MLEFAIATPWDDGFLTDLDALNRAGGRSRFGEIFGAHRCSVTGGGRPSFRLPEVSTERFERHVRRAKDLGLRFNYVMNAPDLAGLENDAQWRRRLRELLEYLAGQGVDKLTLTHPFLLRLVKREHPGFGVTLSLIAGVDSVAKAKEYEDLGVDTINLSPFTVNRDFAALHAIREAVQCKLEVYANIACLDRCPMRDAHYLHSGRHSQDSGVLDIGQDAFLKRCSAAFLADPTELLRSPFIRPEDVQAYREVGMDIVKLADRTEPPEVLSNTARIYHAERYDGNLFELIFRRGNKFRAAVGASHPRSGELAVPIVIDNRVLTRIGFLDRIKSLQGQERDAFYGWATREAVTFTDAETIETWQDLLGVVGPPGGMGAVSSNSRASDRS